MSILNTIIDFSYYKLSYILDKIKFYEINDMSTNPTLFETVLFTFFIYIILIILLFL